MRLLSRALAAGLLLGAAGCGPRPSPRMKRLPRLMLWAWERPEDLSSLPVDKVGVAWLRQTLFLRGGALERRPRRQPLKLPSGARLLAVTRIEVDPSQPLQPSPALVRETAEAVLRELPPEALGVQVDFDARASQRPFYRELLKELRARMPGDMPLSMTALASWACFDGWIADLPVDEAVPMCFDMGSDTRAIRNRLEHRQDFPVPLARRALGVGLREPLPWTPRDRRVYVFSHSPWTPELLRLALQDFGS